MYLPKICQSCLEKYQPNSGAQKWCASCGNKIKTARRNKWHRKWYLKNKEKEALRKHLWYEKNKGRLLQKHKEYMIKKRAEKTN